MSETLSADQMRIFGILSMAMNKGKIVKARTICGENWILLPVLLSPSTCVFFQRKFEDWQTKLYQPIKLKITEIANVEFTALGSGFTPEEFDAVQNVIEKYPIHHCWLSSDWRPIPNADGKFVVKL